MHHSISTGSASACLCQQVPPRSMGRHSPWGLDRASAGAPRAWRSCCSPSSTASWSCAAARRSCAGGCRARFARDASCAPPVAIRLCVLQVAGRCIHPLSLLLLGIVSPGLARCLGSFPQGCRCCLVFSRAFLWRLVLVAGPKMYSDMFYERCVTPLAVAPTQGSAPRTP